jgi:UDP-N-acetylmuramate--alanine ligase
LPSLEGRRLWFVGIGGAGMSALAIVARGWGAEVAGWDRTATAYLEPLEDVDLAIAPRPPQPPDGWEVIVSTAFAGQVDGRSRGELLAELVASERSVVVAGAHGKTTTTAMIAYCLVQLGHDPTFLVGGVVPQLGANARAGSGWLVAEGDESDRSLQLLRPELGVLTNIDLDHHATFSSRGEVEWLFERWLAGCKTVVRGDLLEPVAIPLSLPGDHNRRNAAAALATLQHLGISRGEAEAAISTFRGVGRRLERVGERNGVVVVDDYAHHPTEISATIAAVREQYPDARVLVVFQPHLFSRTRYLATELAFALSAADAVCVTDVYAAREDPLDGVTGKLIVDALAARRPGMKIGWTPRLGQAAALVAHWTRRNDTVLTVGAGDVDRVGAMILGALDG